VWLQGDASTIAVIMLAAALLLVHLVSFAAYLGAGFAQLQMLKRSKQSGVGADTRNHLETLAATIVTKIELPAIFGSILSGVGFIAQNGALMKMGWLHAKLLCVLLLAILSHLEMFNARAIVKARAARGEGASEEIDARKKKHELFGAVGSLLVVVLLVLVTFVRLNGSG
jgi:uncharacterized membrane protein